MTHFVFEFAGLVGKSRIEAMNEAFRDKSTESPAQAIAILAIVACVAAGSGLIYWMYKKRSERFIDDSQLLFRELCKTHGLTRVQRNVLLAIAKAKALKDPCEVILNSDHWVFDPSENPGLCAARNRTRLVILRRTLFKEEAPAKEPVAA